MLAPAQTQRIDVAREVRDAARAQGRLAKLVESQLANPGKQIRAQLALRCSAALSVPEDAATSWAIACELLHNASLVHDDLIDRDEERRGRPAIWSRFGESDAILLGDHLLNAAYGVLAAMDIPAEPRVRLIQLASESVSSVIRGAIGERDRASDLDHYETTVRNKTGRFLSLPAEGALVLAGHGLSVGPAREALSWFGTAYQIADDVADLSGTKDGRPAASDLRARLATAPVVHFRRAAVTEEVDALDSFLAGDASSDSEVVIWRSRLLASEAVADCRRHVERCLELAEEFLSRLPEPVQAPIRALASRLVESAEEQP